MVKLSHEHLKTVKTDMKNWLKRRDIFGVPVGLTYNFYPVHRTVISGSLSILLRVYMVHFAASTYIKILKGHTENVHSHFMTFDVDDPKERFIPSESGFNLGFGFTKGFPPSYGNISFSVVSRDSNGLTEKKVDTYPCSQIRSNWTE